MNKLKIPYEKSLPMIQEMIKMVALASEIGKDSSWIHNKQNHNRVREKERTFNESNIVELNEGLESIGNKLLQTIISSDCGREEIIAQVKSLSTIVSMPYLYEKKMGKNRAWYSNRMKKPSPSGLRYYFNEEDILSMNMSIREIANKLLSIEITL